MWSLVKIDKNEAESLINDSEIRPEESLQTLVLKIFQKTGKPLHYLDLLYVVVNIGYYEAHNKKIPQDPYRSLRAVLRQDRGICNFSQGIYGLSEWKNVAAEVISNEEVNVTEQVTQQDSNNVNNRVEDLDNEKKNCPKCNERIDIKLHFCTSCGADLSGFCKGCLYKLEEYWIFCGNCGTKLEQRIRKSTCM